MAIASSRPSTASRYRDHQPCVFPRQLSLSSSRAAPVPAGDLPSACQALAPSSSLPAPSKPTPPKPPLKRRHHHASQRATPMLVVLICIELSDVLFAVDSIPAVVGITQDPFIVVSPRLLASNAPDRIQRLKHAAAQDAAAKSLCAFQGLPCPRRPLSQHPASQTHVPLRPARSTPPTFSR